MARSPVSSLAGLRAALAVVAALSAAAPAVRAQTGPVESRTAVPPQGAGPGQIFRGRNTASGASPALQGERPAQAPVAGPGQIPMQAAGKGRGLGEQGSEQEPGREAGQRSGQEPGQAGRGAGAAAGLPGPPAARQGTPEAVPRPRQGLVQPQPPQVRRDRRPPPMQPFEVQRAVARQQEAERRQRAGRPMPAGPAGPIE